MLSEIVTYSQKADTIRRATKGDEKPKDDGIKTQVIEAVTVTAERPRVKISTLRRVVSTSPSSSPCLVR